jgi:hypothetical protein
VEVLLFVALKQSKKEEKGPHIQEEGEDDLGFWM